MAEDKNIVSQPPLTTPLLDQTGRASRAWAIWFRDVYNRTSYKGGNAIDGSIEDINELIAVVEVNVVNIEKNAEAISENSEAILQNSLAITENTESIATNANAIIILAEGLDNHVGASEAHGSNGNIVGFNDSATEAINGLVKQMAIIADAIQTTVNITTADIGPAPAAYDQNYTQLIANLTNESKAAINQLATDLNASINTINSVITESKSSGQMNNS
ncbi:coil containing protein [Vibrio phage 1.211.B._10N.222.52.F11]|nr:coil containing protein [Vibrio phage 1.211.A._10N.222.52.F11]AUR95746.1 coil containing protein [Vibrio phage 1.211.B._10N.222.52.F11]